jgi:ligand-binding sensor domain-containing protein
VAEVAVNGSRAWIAAVGGVISIDLSTIRDERPSQFRLSDAEGLISPEVTCLTIDAFGNVWVGTREDGVSVFDSSGRHLRNLFAFDELLWSDKVIAAGAVAQVETCEIDFGSGPETLSCARVAVSSADSYNAATGRPEGGGFFIVRVTQRGGDWIFDKDPGTGIGIGIERSQELLSELDEIWVGTGGGGLWRRDNASGDRELVLSVNQGGLVNDNVKKLARAPVPGQPGPEPLWIGTGAGLHIWNGTVLDTVSQFLDRNILDLYRNGDRMYVLTETPSLVRDLYEIDLTQPIDTLRIPRSNCPSDTLYVPREVAVASDGKVVLGSRSRSFFVRDGFDWICPPPLGPHWPRIADLDIGLDGVLYFGTGDQNRQPDVNGVGVYDFFEWSSITTANSNLLDANVTEIESWPDTTRWFGTRVSANVGGVNRYFPATGQLTQYHPAAPEGRRTLGRNVWSMAQDAQNNLWICYGQEGGGLSVIEWPSEQITNFSFDTLFSNATTALRDISFDTYGRVWVTTQSSGTTIGKVYVVDTRGTISNQADDILTEFNVANEIGSLGEIRSVTVDPSNQVWLGGNLGLAVGEIVDSGVNTVAVVSWRILRPTSTQLGGRNPLPYRVSVLDDANNVWLGTQSSGLVRVSPDQVVWTWFDQFAGCPLPDQSITGLHWDDRTRSMWIGTPSSGIARVGLTAGTSGQEQSIEAYPNPWRPAEQGAFVTFGGIPPDETTTVRIYNTAGELVVEMTDMRGDKVWNGRNVRDVIVESGVYVVTATSSDGTRGKYEGKVAVIR